MVKPANNGAHSSASRKRAVTIPSEDEASTQSPKRNRSESNDQSDRLGPQSISNDNQTYRTPYAIKYYQGDQQKFTRLTAPMDVLRNQTTIKPPFSYMPPR